MEGVVGGPDRDRTDDLFHAMEARSQLRHRPTLRKDSLYSQTCGALSQTPIPSGDLILGTGSRKDSKASLDWGSWRGEVSTEWQLPDRNESEFCALVSGVRVFSHIFPPKWELIGLYMVSIAVE